jgi:hypothetical protein
MASLLFLFATLGPVSCASPSQSPKRLVDLHFPLFAVLCFFGLACVPKEWPRLRVGVWVWRAVIQVIITLYNFLPGPGLLGDTFYHYFAHVPRKPGISALFPLLFTG